MTSAIRSRILLPHAKTLYRQFASSSSVGTSHVYKLPDLPYDYGALEPAISGQIMKTHHQKHHQTYVNNLNSALAQYAEAEHKGDLTKQIALQGALRFNGGGHLNHSIFWTNLAPQSQGGGAPPTGDLAKLLDSQWGSFDQFKTEFSAACVGIQGSGWGWLGYNKLRNKLEIITKPNQDPLTEAVPILGVDVWEHAYYYLYGPARAEYLKQIWSIVNWKNAAERLANAK